MGRGLQQLNAVQCYCSVSLTCLWATLRFPLRRSFIQFLNTLSWIFFQESSTALLRPPKFSREAADGTSSTVGVDMLVAECDDRQKTEPEALAEGEGVARSRLRRQNCA